MSNQNHGDDLRAVWQSQKTEPYTMTMDEVRQRAEDLRTRVRRKRLGTLAGPAVSLFAWGFCFKEFPGQRQLLQPLFLTALAWSLAGLYFLNRGMGTVPMPDDAGIRTGLEFCRTEIARQRLILQRVLLWSLAPIVLALGLLVAALARVGGILPKGLPFLILAGAWAVAYFVIRFREQQRLGRELEELDERSIQ